MVVGNGDLEEGQMRNHILEFLMFGHKRKSLMRNVNILRNGFQN